jgi:hypothetical protein
MKKFTLIALALSLLCTAAFAQEATVSSEKEGFKLGIHIQGKTVKVSVEAPAKGWVGVGIDPVGGMRGADFLIGFVKEGVTVVRDDFGIGPFAHASDASQGGIDSIMASTGEEKGGVTRIVFTLPLDSQDTKDARWTPGKHAIIMACSNADSFTGPHFKRVKFEIELPELKK